MVACGVEKRQGCSAVKVFSSSKLPFLCPQRTVVVLTVMIADAFPT